MSPIAENYVRSSRSKSAPAYFQEQRLVRRPIQSGVNDSLRIAQAAIIRSKQNGADYARAKAPTSPNPNISGNKNPGKTELTWLKDRSKCNQFVGDVLTDAGFAMPMNKMKDGTFHYASAESLSTHVSNFAQVSIDQARVGDIVVFDWQKKGENGAHVQIITKLDAKRNILELTGASSAGAKTQDYSALLKGGQINQNWLDRNNAELYLLRPIKIR